MSAHPPLTQNINRLSRLELPGAGQVTVQGHHAYVGHIPNKAGLGTSILDVSDPRNPRIISQIMLDDPESHTHKARVVGDIMIVNNERNMTLIGRKADELPGLRIKLRERFGRDATHAELADALNVREADIPAVEAAEKQPYDRGGFKIYDVSDKTRPRLLCHQKTGGIGVHRFDMDENYAYISTEMAGYIGNILVIYDIRNPSRPQEVSRWWIPGQHLAGAKRPRGTGAAPGCTMRCGMATNCGRDCGTAGSESSTSATSASRPPWACTTIIRPSPSRRTPSCRWSSR
ncbi:LVIVD repeat-containing protein [Pigmentiphaga litoralis]|uniref:LVIVD repeat-containing protein n=1 Tax=Pigmentiphaga litoralis TaxID=516702 RepID=UPI003B429688